MQMYLKPALNKPLYMPFAWIRLVLEKDAISSHLLTNNSLDLWNECQSCIHDHISEIVNPLELAKFESKVIHETTGNIEMIVYNNDSKLAFNLCFCGNDWYIDLDNWKKEICNG